MKLIKANNLKRWADTLEIRGLLSELIRRLVHATKSQYPRRMLCKRHRF